MNQNPDPMLLRAAQAQAAQAQATAAMNAKLEGTAIQIYAQLAAMEYHQAQRRGMKEADPYGQSAEPVEIKLEIDGESLENAAQFARHAAIVAFVAWGQLKRPEGKK